MKEPTTPWAASIDEIVEQLDVDPGAGLSRTEVIERRAAFGANRLAESRRRSSWAILVDQFRSLIMGLLVVAMLVSVAFGEIAEGVAIAVVLLVNTAVGFVTERRAVRSMEALRALGSVAATVRRDGEVREIPAEELVPGDVVILEAGAVVSADLRLTEASRLQANESTLTGESAPVGKHTDRVGAETSLMERDNMLHRGTAVTRGDGVGVVVATGERTEVGRIAALVEEAEPEITPLERRLDRLGRRLVWISAGAAGLIAVTGVLTGRDLLLSIQTAIALAVAAIPEGLPIVATLALARGMWRMAHRNALIRNLAAVETLGSTTLILTDKTGTLTENRMTVVRMVLPEGGVGIESGEFRLQGRVLDPADEPGLVRALRIGALCNRAVVDGGDGVGIGDPLEVALLEAAHAAGIDRAEVLQECPEMRSEAFDPEEKMMATFHAVGGKVEVAVKGAPVAVIAACTRVREAGSEQPLDDARRRAWLDHNAALAESGLRILAIATRRVSDVSDAPYRDLELVGLIGLLDPPRVEVREAIARAREAGIRVVMVTGDQLGTARSIAEAVGFETGESLQTALGDEIERETIVDIDLFARTTPAQKLEIIDAHQTKGAIVGMIGDGVNDAPGLRKADIGVAMGQRGTQIAREAADMVLEDDRFDTIVMAIEQGRVIFANIRKFVIYLLSCNLSEILIVGVATMAGAPLPILPLQILFLNLVTDVFPALALGVGEGSPGIMTRPPRDPSEPVITRDGWTGIVGYGAVITVAVLAGLAISIRALGMATPRAVSISFLILAFAQLVHVFNMSEEGAGWRNEVTSNPWVWRAVALCTGLLLAAVYLPGLSDILRLVDPGLAGWALVAALSPVTLLARAIRRSIP